jgi:ribA/ribD-fused uncharacterized protein
MRTLDQKATVPVEVKIASTDASCVAVKDIVLAAAKKFKSVTKQSRVYNGTTRLEMVSNLLLEELTGTHLLLTGKAGWKGAAVAGAGYASEKVGEDDADALVLAAPSSPSTTPAAKCTQDDLAKAARSERSDGVVLLWKDTQDNGYLSNWAKSPFSLDGTDYNCVEQWIMSSKARACRDDSIREQVMQTANPKKQKALGRSIDKKAVDRHWRIQQKWNIQLRGCRAKFQQNEMLATRLLQTGRKPIAEASPSDTIFGIGLAPNNPLAQDPANWKGQNLLGKALMQVREELCHHILDGKGLASFPIDPEVESSSKQSDLVAIDLYHIDVSSETDSDSEISDTADTQT